jgi:hypothetical protein
VQEMRTPSDTEFFVEWQLVDCPEDLIDLTTAETEALQPDASLSTYDKGKVPARR